MLIRWEDRDWDFDFEGITNRQAMAMETGLGMSLAEFYDLLQGDDGFDAAKPHFLTLMTVAYWLMLDQDGTKVAITDVEFPVLRFAEALVAAMVADAAARPAAQGNGEAKPGPTRPRAGSAPSRAPSSRSKKSKVVTAGSPDG